MILTLVDFMVKIIIRKTNTAVLISFDIKSEKFESLSQRSRFFEELYGRNQIIRKAEKTYKYHREGILDNMNHMRIDNSVFIIAQEHLRQMQEFMREWEDKVMFKTFPVLLKQQELKQLEREAEGD